MKKVFRKNQVIITTMAFLIAIAGYISYERSNAPKEDEAKQANAIEDDYIIYDAPEGTEIVGMSESEEVINPGETVLTSSPVAGIDYAADVKLNREQIRSKNKEALLEIINNTGLTDEQKQTAVNEMVELTDIAQKEADAEMMLEAKGFTNVVVSISEENCDVVLDMGDVTDAKRAQVEDIVKRKTGIAADKIVITTINE